MDIPINIADTYFKFARYILGIQMEGSMSQNVDTGTIYLFYEIYEICEEN